jgi:hypothetical protein
VQATPAEAPHDHGPETLITRGKTAMRHVLRQLMLLFLTAATCASAEDVRPGDQVRFIERDQHIPAHPAPGDTRVHLRSVSGSAATVLRVNAATGWIVDLDVYDVHVDDHPKGALNGQQNTDFAVKRGLTVVRQPDFKALDIRGDGRLRYGARIDLTHNGQTIQLMSVHLKRRQSWQDYPSFNLGTLRSGSLITCSTAIS